MKRGLSEREIDELIKLARESCEASADYRTRLHTGEIGADAEATIKKYLNYLDARIASYKRAGRSHHATKIVPIGACLTWKAVK
jgi:hypothetical protein